ncbi:MAG: RluA family pseudouridine synthase [Lachnospiraceae bacterium]|nr:RluA family pseudouridine synthase [Lachnospiraceae bacterium]
MKTEILFEDDDILICRKPAGFPTQTAKIGQQDVVSELKNYLAKAIDKEDAKTAQKSKKEPYLGIVHRLDQPVEGVLAFGKTPEATAYLTKSLQEGSLHKHYYAISYNQPFIEKGILEDYMIKDSKTNMAKIVPANTEGAKKAVLYYKIMDAKDGKVLYDISIETGRFHQIRAQMAHADMPLLGDQKYADERVKEYSREAGIKNVALCAYELAIKHPRTKEELSFVVQPEGAAFIDFFGDGGTFL